MEWVIYFEVKIPFVLRAFNNEDCLVNVQNIDFYSD